VKVVLFCGGRGIRIRQSSPDLPKPMVRIGYRPILWHVMKYYAHHGHTDFILCLGYKADVIKNYFLRYNEALSNDFVLSDGGERIELFKNDIKNWRITFVDAGLNANIGQRLFAVREHLKNEEMFLANYADGLTDVPVPAMIDQLRQSSAVGTFVCVKPLNSFHIVTSAGDGIVSDIRHMTDADFWINGGYFVFRRQIFDHLNAGEELVEQPFQRLIAKRALLAYKYTGFWGCMDTFKDKQRLESLYAEGRAPWVVWK
jgi:glucose-1-phosphate cytidylyltransferase